MSYVEGDRIYRKAIRFLACREKSSAPHAVRVWKKFRDMIGDVGFDYDEEASEFVSTLMDVIVELDPDINPALGLTREELRRRDLDVAKAARAFVAALDNHPSRDFRRGHWCQLAARRDTTASSPRIVPVRTEEVPWEALQELAIERALNAPPLPRLVALRIEKHARRLAASRMELEKSRQSETAKTLLRRQLERRLIEALYVLYPGATANQTAGVVAPIVEQLFDAPGSFDRCRNLARNLIQADKKKGG